MSASDPNGRQRGYPEKSRISPLGAAGTQGALPLNIAEEMIGLFHTIDALLPGDGAKIVQFIGSQEGEGTSTVVQEFASVVSAQLNKAVFLLDADGPPSDPSTPSASHQDNAWAMALSEGHVLGEEPDKLGGQRSCRCPISTLAPPR